MPFGSIEFSLYIPATLYALRNTIFPVSSTSYSLHCTLYNVPANALPVYAVHATTHPLSCTSYSALWGLLEIFRLLFDTVECMN